MTATTGIWNPASQAAASPFSGVRAMDSNSGSDSSNSDGATISANDFLTLLVTEMQNQDPTATTDPNEYINQLVNVNSLEQLISINQTLQTAAGVTVTESASAGAAATPQAASATANPATTAHAAAVKGPLGSMPSTGTPPVPVSHDPVSHTPVRIVRGNLGSVPASSSALRVAHALDAPRITR